MVYKIYINDDPGLTVTYFKVRSKLVKLLIYQARCQVSVNKTICSMVILNSK